LHGFPLLPTDGVLFVVFLFDQRVEAGEGFEIGEKNSGVSLGAE